MGDYNHYTDELSISLMVVHCVLKVIIARLNQSTAKCVKDEIRCIRLTSMVARVFVHLC